MDGPHQQQLQYVPMAGGAPDGKKGNLFGKMSDAVARNSGLVVAVLVVLIVLVGYLFARVRGMFGGCSAGSGKSGFAKSASGGKKAGKKKQSRHSANREETAEEDEIDRLIEELED